MTQIKQFQIKNKSTNKGLKFHYATATDDNITFNNVTLSAAGQEAANNFGVNFGYKRLISVDFVLLNDGTDKSLTSENKITLTEQWRYLMETVVQGFTTNEQYKTKFELTLYTDSGTWTVSGNLEDISVRGDLSNNSNRIEGRLSLYQSANI